MEAFKRLLERTTARPWPMIASSLMSTKTYDEAKSNVRLAALAVNHVEELVEQLGKQDCYVCGYRIGWRGKLLDPLSGVYAHDWVTCGKCASARALLAKIEEESK